MKKRFLTLGLILLSLSSFASPNKDWKAKWISTQDCQSSSNTWLAYHKTVEIPKPQGEVWADIAVDSKYWLWINGTLVVFEGGLKRGPNPEDTYYDKVDLTPYLKEGKNSIAILMWYFGKDGFSHSSSGRAGMVFDCQANNFTIISDNSWKCGLYSAYQNTGAPHPNFRLPESNIRYDARNEMSNWTAAEANPSLPNAIELGEVGCAPWNNLVERPIPLWKDYGITDYLSKEVRKGNEADTIICKLPYNCHVTPYLELNAPAGKTIDIRTDNYQGGCADNVRAEYITKEGKQSYESLGWMNGHSMIYIVPKGVEVVNLKYRETGYNTTFSGTFSCNDSFLNRLREKALRTLYVTMRDTYMDCPDRERSQWWGDEVNELGEAFYALSPDGNKLAHKGILELMGWQRADGVIFSPCPAGNWRTELPIQMLASVGHYGFYTYYKYSADSSFVPIVYDRLHRYLHEVWKTDSEGLVIGRSGDWSWGDWGENIDMDLLFNTWYYLALKAEKEFAQILNKTNDVKQISEMMLKMEQAYNQRFWTGSEYRSPNYKGKTDDRGNAMSVLAGFAKPNQFPQLLEVFKRERHASPYMEKYIGEALFVMNYPTEALKRTRERFADMTNHPDYTTLWEGWGVGPQGFGGGTINHAWSGGTLTLLSQYVAGIAPLTPGFETFTVAPQMGDLTSLTTTIDTQYGLITVQIKRNGKRHQLVIEVPNGTTAIIKGNKKQVVLKSGKHSVSIDR